MVCGAQTVVHGATRSVRLNQLDRLAVCENVHDLRHRSVHGCPKIIVPLRRGERYQGTSDAVFVCRCVEIDTSWVSWQIVEVCTKWSAATTLLSVDLGQIIVEIPTLNIAGECSPFSCELPCEWHSNDAQFGLFLVDSLGNNLHISRSRRKKRSSNRRATLPEFEAIA